MGFFQRMGRGAKRAAEYKEKFEKWQDEKAEKHASRAVIDARRYEMEAKAVRARASLEEAKNRLSKVRQGSGFGFGFGGMGMPRPQGNMGMVDLGFGSQPQQQKAREKIRVVYRKPKKQKSKRVRYVSAPQPKQPRGIRGLDFM